MGGAALPPGADRRIGGPGCPGLLAPGRPPAATGRPRRRATRTVAVLADSTRRLFAERAGLARSLSFPDLSRDNVNLAIERARTQANDPPDIVLVIGRPVRVRGVVLLQTAEQATARGTSADELREAVVGGGLLEPEVVTGMQARLFIAMGAPGETVAASTPSDVTPLTCAGGRPTSSGLERRR